MILTAHNLGGGLRAALPCIPGGFHTAPRGRTMPFDVPGPRKRELCAKGKAGAAFGPRSPVSALVAHQG